MRGRLRVAGLLLAALLAPFAVYLLCALALGATPRNPGFTESPAGVPVYVRTNGVHADLVVPTHHGEIDWRGEFPPAQLGAAVTASNWIAFGWGDQRFLLETPTWSDLRLSVALAALTGRGPGAMHVEYVETPQAYDAARVRLSDAQYTRLAAYIRASFARDAAGRVQKVDAPGYFGRDAFYKAVPRYSAVHTCNEWTRRSLQEAGVRTPAWSPFDAAIFAQLRRIASETTPQR
jgi:uncharacterized protein (TIGR02117 family)